MSSAYYALVLGNRPFPNLLFYQILLKLIFPIILRVFDFECHGQTSVKVELLMFRLVFMKFRKLRIPYQENEKLDPRKT